MRPIKILTGRDADGPSEAFVRRAKARMQRWLRANPDADMGDAPAHIQRNFQEALQHGTTDRTAA